jgi:hypothetical protein
VTSKIDHEQNLIEQVADLEARLHRAQSDLEDQNEIRAKWKALAEKAEDAQVSCSCLFHLSNKFEAPAPSMSPTPSTTRPRLLWLCARGQPVHLYLYP